MKPQDRLAPISSAPPILLMVAAWNFMLNGAANIVLAILTLAGARRLPLSAGLIALVVGLGFVSGAGLFWTGRLLQRGVRLGGWIALGFTLLPVVPWLFGVTLDWVTVFWTVLTLLVLVSFWDHLS